MFYSLFIIGFLISLFSSFILASIISLVFIHFWLFIIIISIPLLVISYLYPWYYLIIFFLLLILLSSYFYLSINNLHLIFYRLFSFISYPIVNCPLLIIICSPFIISFYSQLISGYINLSISFVHCRFLM